MIKYSLQNECLENIEAFSDEQFNAEISVFESVLDVFDKSILIMEMSNSEEIIPECSLFMESTFFQEADPAQPVQNAENAQTTTNTDEKKEASTSISEEERKKYNSEHQFRQKNKKGKVENIFISIIAFIPRFLGFLIQCIVKFVKKLANKEKSENEKKVKEATEEEKKAVDAEIKNKEGSSEAQVTYTGGEIAAAATVNAKGAQTSKVNVGINGNGETFINIDLDKIESMLTGSVQTFVDIPINKNSLSSVQPISTDIKTVKQQMDEAAQAKEAQRRAYQLEALSEKKARVLKGLSDALPKLKNTQKIVQGAVDELKNDKTFASHGYDLSQVVAAREEDLKDIKQVVVAVNAAITQLTALDALTDTVVAKYVEILDKVRKTNLNRAEAQTHSALQNKQALARGAYELDSGKNAPSQAFTIDTKVANPGGENNNGGQG